MSGTIRLFIPLEKIDKGNRTVGGWATTEVVDRQNEIVDYNASKAAFTEWRGNLREMHQPVAVGKAIEVVPNDDERRIYVKAFISKGAEDTWQKVLDGTLTGFSIGGNTVDKVVQLIKDNADSVPRQVTRITKYRLNELSLVDNPANPEAVFELVKADQAGNLRQTEIVEDLHTHDPSGSTTILRKDGDTPDMDHTLLKELIGKVASLVEKVDGLIKAAYEGPHKPAPGSKDTPKQATDGKDATQKTTAGTNEPAQTGASEPVAGAKETPKQTTTSEHVNEGDMADYQTQKPEGAYPAKGPVKATDAGETAKADGMESYKEDDEYVYYRKPKSVGKAANPATSPHRTQDSQAAPVKKEAEDDKEDGDEDTGKTDGDSKQEKTSKAASAEDIKKLEATVESLRKQVEELRKEPLPRKYHKVEKTWGTGAQEDTKTADEIEVEKAYKEVLDAQRSGQPLSKAMEAKKDWVLNKLLERKVQNLQKG